MIKPGTMVKHFPRPIKSALGNFMIEHTVMDEDFIKKEQMSAAFSPERYYEVLGLEPGTYVKLVGKGHGIMMSDTPMEINTNCEFVREARGDVLIAGLGIGLVLLSIQDKENVNSITVVELYSELIDLIAPRIPLNKKVKIVNADIFKWLPPDGMKYDTIYFDIWDEICGDNYPATKELHKQFRKYLNKIMREDLKGDSRQWWMDSWRRDDFKRKYFEDKEYFDDMSRFNSAKIEGVEELKKEFDKMEA